MLFLLKIERFQLNGPFFLQNSSGLLFYICCSFLKLPWEGFPWWVIQLRARHFSFLKFDILVDYVFHECHQLCHQLNTWLFTTVHGESELEGTEFRHLSFNFTFRDTDFLSACQYLLQVSLSFILTITILSEINIVGEPLDQRYSVETMLFRDKWDSFCLSCGKTDQCSIVFWRKDFTRPFAIKREGFFQNFDLRTHMVCTSAVFLKPEFLSSLNFADEAGNVSFYKWSSKIRVFLVCSKDSKFQFYMNCLANGLGSLVELPRITKTPQMQNIFDSEFDMWFWHPHT